jgi:5-methylcytosine-specific restriction enzyme A
MKTEPVICELCKGETTTWEKHHKIPRCKGGRHGEILKVCKTCGGQVHMLFTVKELAKMTLEQLTSTPEMRKYLEWKQKHPGEFRHRMSTRVKS